jgi:hypothetical protein
LIAAQINRNSIDLDPGHLYCVGEELCPMRCGFSPEDDVPGNVGGALRSGRILLCHRGLNVKRFQSLLETFNFDGQKCTAAGIYLSSQIIPNWFLVPSIPLNHCL